MSVIKFLVRLDPLAHVDVGVHVVVAGQHRATAYTGLAAREYEDVAEVSLSLAVSLRSTRCGKPASPAVRTDRRRAGGVG